MVWQALGLYLRNLPANPDSYRKNAERNNTFLTVAIAAVLFAFSDSIIAWDKFVNPFEWSGVIILATYWMAIYLLADSTSFEIDKSRNEEKIPTTL